MSSDTIPLEKLISSEEIKALTDECKSVCPLDCMYTEGSVSSVSGRMGIGCPGGDICDQKHPPPGGCAWYLKEYNIDPNKDYVQADNTNCPTGYTPVPTLWQTALKNGAESVCDCPVGVLPFQKYQPSCHIPKLCAPIDPHTQQLDNSTKINCCTSVTTDPVGNKCGPGWCPNGSPCAAFFTGYCRNGYTSDCRSFLANTTNQQAKKDVINSIMESLYPNNENVSSKTSDSNKIATDICKLQPGACDSFLQKRCAWVKDIKDIEDDDHVIQLCGCFLDKSIYDKDYAVLAKPPLPIECTPPCTFPDAITPGVPDVSGGGEHFATCKRHICVMDDITITIINSKFIGDINFEVLCGGISEASSCYFSNIAVTEIDSKLEGKVKFDVDCNNSCYTFEHDNPINTTRVDCKTFKPYGDKSTCNKKDCDDSDECPDGYCPICSKGKCRARPYSKNCEGKADCPAGQNCINGKCLKTCLSTSDCPEGLDCVGGTCLLPCKNNKDCDTGMTCQNNYCQPSTPGGKCQKDTDCPTGYRCNVVGKCVAINGGGNGDGDGFVGALKKYWWVILIVLVSIVILVVSIHFVLKRKRQQKLKALQL